MRRSSILLLVLWAAGTAKTLASTNAPAPSTTNATSHLEHTAERIDKYHEVLSLTVTETANRLDSWLSGSSYLADQQQDTRLRVRLSFRFERDKSIQVSPALSGKVSLPHFEKRFHVFIDNLKRNTLPGENEEDRYNDAPKIGLGVNLLKKARGILGLDGGIDMDPWPVPFSSLTGVWKIPVRGWTTTLSEQINWKETDGFGEVTEMDWDKVITSNLLFRSITAGNWAETTEGVEFEQTLRLTWQQLPKRRVWEFSGSVFANKVSAFYMENYRVQINYWTLLWQRWLALDIGSQIEFPKEESYEFVPSIRIGFSAYFGAKS